MRKKYIPIDDLYNHGNLDDELIRSLRAEGYSINVTLNDNRNVCIDDIDICELPNVLRLAQQ